MRVFLQPDFLHFLAFKCFFFHSIDTNFSTEACVYVCRCIICIEATKHTVLLTDDTSENYLKDSVMVAVASVRTWLEVGPEDKLLCQHSIP